LEEIVSSSADERPIQELLTQIPTLVANLLGPGHDRFVIPKQALSVHYVPDFLFAVVDSAGIHWSLLELESPTAELVIDRGRDFGEKVRHGIQQIRTWREWLMQNLAHAHLPKRDLGLAYRISGRSLRG
jgi:hypothetical protein